MSVYPAYFLVVGHVVLGALRARPARSTPGCSSRAAAGLIVLHGLARGSGTGDRHGAISPDGAWVDVGDVGEIAENAAKVVCLAGREGASRGSGTAAGSRRSRCSSPAGPARWVRDA